MTDSITRLRPRPRRPDTALLPVLLLATCCLLMTACGQKGDLYLPEGEPVELEPLAMKQEPRRIDG